jgi:hypothetical protein
VLAAACLRVANVLTKNLNQIILANISPKEGIIALM